MLRLSPLRYPGGKLKIFSCIREIIATTEQRNITYIEPFAGGAGLALELLFTGCVENIIINDSDKAIYSIWRAILEKGDDFIDRIYETPLTIDEWYKQKEIYHSCRNKYSLDLGFSAFYLNRTNYSGILDAGPIGGYQQNGRYKIDARFDKSTLVTKVKRIATQKKHISVYNYDARIFLKRSRWFSMENSFVYFDPPYFVNGRRLYRNFLQERDHVEIARSIEKYVRCPWIVTYDDVEFLRELYKHYPKYSYEIKYSATNKLIGNELMIFSNLALVPKWLRNSEVDL